MPIERKNYKASVIVAHYGRTEHSALRDNTVSETIEYVLNYQRLYGRDVIRIDIEEEDDEWDGESY